VPDVLPVLALSPESGLPNFSLQKSLDISLFFRKSVITTCTSTSTMEPSKETLRDKFGRVQDLFHHKIMISINSKPDMKCDTHQSQIHSFSNMIAPFGFN
jgi:hypothetical protein